MSVISLTPEELENHASLSQTLCAQAKREIKCYLVRSAFTLEAGWKDTSEYIRFDLMIIRSFHALQRFVMSHFNKSGIALHYTTREWRVYRLNQQACWLSFVANVQHVIASLGKDTSNEPQV